MSDDALAALLLTNRLVDVGVRPLGSAELWALLAGVPSPASLLTAEGRATALRAGSVSIDDAARIATLVDAAAAFAFERERLEEEGVRLLSTFDPEFPARLISTLGASCPAFLTVAGPVGWLDAPGLGVVGSRDAPQEALDVATTAASVAVRDTVPIVGGLTPGVDRAATTAGLDAGGPVVGIPAEGLRIAARDPDVRRRVHAGELCIASPFAPSARLSAGAASGRTKIIYALSSVTLVVHADNGSGDTWTGATEALANGYSTVAAFTGRGAGPGNAALLRAGATPVADLDRVMLAERLPRPPEDQSSLF